MTNSDDEDKLKSPIEAELDKHSPLLLVPGGPKNPELGEAERQERYGPPFGPCGLPCDCEKCTAHRAELRKEGPKPKRPPKKKKRDAFDRAIAQVLKGEPREDWRETISETGCFAREWYDKDDGSFCDQLECDLRDLCEKTWNKVEGGLSADSRINAPAQVRRLGKKKRKAKPKGPSRGKWKGTGKFDRVPYVDQGRQIDRVANAIYQFLGSPASLPIGWTYPVSKTKEQQESARTEFRETYGHGVFVIRRASYHQYFANGAHLLRLWVNAAGGGWADCSGELSKVILKEGKGIFEVTPSTGKKTKFRFYPYRIFLSHPRSVNEFLGALTKCPGLEYLQKIDEDSKDQ
jgi:hypothetical protein